MVKADLTETRGVCLEYETFGNPKDPACLLIMGLGASLVYWRVELCQKLVEKGFYVIRFDNRDAGLSTFMDHLGPAPVLWNGFLSLFGQTGTSPYTLEDMAADSMALLDRLYIGQAHVVGASMGGMIAQLCAIHYPDRVLSITSIMSTTGDPWLPGPSLGVKLKVISARPDDYEGLVQGMLDRYRVMHTPEIFDQYKDVTERIVREHFKRSIKSDQGRQLGAILAAKDRTPQLQKAKCKALVIHGSLDPLVLPACGIATHKAIPGSNLLLIERMGHGLPEHAWPEMVDAIAAMKD